MKAACQIQPRTAVCRSSSCCRHTISVMPKRARNRYIIMPKQAICRSSSRCQHIYAIKAQSGRNRHKKYAHAGTMSIQQKAVDIRHMRNSHADFMSNQLRLEISDVGKHPEWLETDISVQKKHGVAINQYIISAPAGYKSVQPNAVDIRHMTKPMKAMCWYSKCCRHRHIINAHAGYMSVCSCGQYKKR